VIYQEFCASTLPKGMEPLRPQGRHRLRARRRLQGSARVLTDLGRRSSRSVVRPMAGTSTCAAVPPRRKLLQLTVSGVQADVASHSTATATPGHGRPPRPAGRRRPADVRDRARPARAGRAAGTGGRHGDEQPGTGAGTQGTRHRVPAPRGSATATCSNCSSSTAACWRRNLGAPAMPGSNHHGRRPRECAAGARGDEAHRPLARELAAGMPQFPQ